MSSFFGRVRAAVSRRRKRAYSSLPGSKESAWKRLPDNVFVVIVASCEINDIANFALACRLLHQRISKNEFMIAQTYLKLRRQKWSTQNENDSDLSPGDDLTFISELFPPPPPHYAVGERYIDAEYSLAYVADLRRCWTTCIQLSYHLADHAVRHHLETDAIARPLWHSSKTEKEFIYSKAVESTQAKILHFVAYAIFFLESSAADGPVWDTSDQFTTNLSSSIEKQQKILQSPPFNDTQVLISTHHFMQLLCSTVRRLMNPDFPYSSSESWMSLLLCTSTLERIVQFFQAIAKDDEKKESASPGSRWSHRKEFMWRMREDLGHYLASSTELSTAGFPTDQPKLEHIWFGAAFLELDERASIPHLADEPVPILHGSTIGLRCAHCWET